MKRVVYYIIVAFLVVSMFPVSAHANENELDMYSFADGSYILIEVTSMQGRATNQVSGAKQYTYHGSDGTVLWKATLNGTFQYTGTSATCTSASCNVSIYDSVWYIISKNPAASGCQATCGLTMGRKVLGITVSKVPISMILSCDANGNLS